jgi:hypothetical protein
MRAVLLAAAMIVFSACSQPARQQSPSNSKELTKTAGREVPPIPPPGTGPDARMPLGRPEAAVDPKSAEAAQAIVQNFADRLEDRDFSNAYELISHAELSLKEREFTSDYSARQEIRTTVGRPTAPEGAAGSIYVTVPLAVSGRYRNREPFRESWKVTLRRVNDVPGSSEEQGRWHIEQIDVRSKR